MATFPLVNIQNDIGTLVKLSLVRHQVSVVGVFEVIEEASGEWFVAIATPIAEEKGEREAYLTIFTALEAESFSTSYLRLHTLVISHGELGAIRRALKKGAAEAYLPKLGRLEDVVVRPVEDPNQVLKSGMLIVSRQTDGSFQLRFNPMDRYLGAKSRHLDTTANVEKCLERLGIEAPDELANLKHSRSISMILSASLDRLYQQGLI